MASRDQRIVYGLTLWCSLSVLSTCTHSNPPVEHSVNWADPTTQSLFKAECMSCHSHETRWPWYSYIAPMSFFIEYQVFEGRSRFNVSIKPAPDRDIVMPRFEKEWLDRHYCHWLGNGSLSPQDKAMLINGLHTTFSSSPSHLGSK